MSTAVRLRSPTLFASINVTPFIDVLLVLLIMLIMTIPVATNKLPLDLPAGRTPPPVKIDPHVLALDANGALYWDGAVIPDDALGARLAAVAKADGPLILKPDGHVRFESFDAVLARVRRAGVGKIGFADRFLLED